MVQINFAQKTVNVKVVYYGPGMSGKTTNLEIVHQRAPKTNKGELTSISTDGDRTLFFDYMPLDLGTVAGMRTCFQLYTVPGQVYYNSTRKLVLQGVDGVIFVADSSASMTEQNNDSLRNLEENLNEYGKSLSQIPMVIQWNKRDLPDALPVEELERLVNSFKVPTFEAMANSGEGVFPTLKSLAALVLKNIMNESGGGKPSFGSPAPPSPAPGMAPVAPLAPIAAPAPAPGAMDPVEAQQAVAPQGVAAQPMAGAPAPAVASAPAPAQPLPQDAPVAPVAQPMPAQGGLNPALSTTAPAQPQVGHAPHQGVAPGAGVAGGPVPGVADVAPQPVAQAPQQYIPPVVAPSPADHAQRPGQQRPTARRTPGAPSAGAQPQQAQGQKRRAKRTQSAMPVSPKAQKGGVLTAVFVVVGVGLGAVLAWFAMSVL